jgi:hypothetical protein
VGSSRSYKSIPMYILFAVICTDNTLCTYISITLILQPGFLLMSFYCCQSESLTAGIKQSVIGIGKTVLSVDTFVYMKLEPWHVAHGI